MNRGKTRPALLGIVLALALAGTGRADYLESFKAGYRAIELRQWQDAAWAMRQAIGQKPQNPHENVRVYGTILVPYIPNYFLGLALYRQGDYAGALTAFEEAAAKGMNRGLYRSRLKVYRDLCADRAGVPRPKLAARQPSSPSPGIGGGSRPTPPPVYSTPVPVPDPVTPATSAEVRKQSLQKMVREGQEWLARGDKAAGSIEQKRQRDPRRFERDPNRVQDLQYAKERLEAARFQLEACRREGDLDGAEEARNDAQAATELLQELEKGLVGARRTPIVSGAWPGGPAERRRSLGGSPSVRGHQAGSLPRLRGKLRPEQLLFGLFKISELSRVAPPKPTSGPPRAP